MILISLAMIMFCILICLNLIMTSNDRQRSKGDYIVKLEEKILQMENMARIKLIDDVKLQEKMSILQQQNSNLLKLDEERKKILLENGVLLNSLEYEKKSREEMKSQIEYFIARINELEKQKL